MPSTTFQRLALRYSDQCELCRVLLPVGSDAVWHPATRAVRCLSCVEGPAEIGEADPFRVPQLDRGTPGRSVQGLFGSNGDIGAEGERRLARLLEGRSGGGFGLIHDRRVPGTRANIDHVAVAPTGVYVIDAKNWSGEVRMAFKGLATRITVDGRDRTDKAVASLDRQSTAVRTALDVEGFNGTEVLPVMCMVNSQWPLFAAPFFVDGVLVTWPRALLPILHRDGPLTFGARQAITSALIEQLPPA